MDFDLKNCQAQSCDNQALSLSDFCSKHIPNINRYKKLLEKYIEEHSEIEHLRLFDIKFSKHINIQNKVFSNCEIIDVALENIVFTDCIFKYCTFNELKIDACHFTKCTFIETDFESIDFEETGIQECKFDKLSLNNTKFIDNSYITNSIFSFCNIKNTKFHELESSKSTKYIDSFFDYCDIIDSNFDKTIFIRIDFKENNIYNSSFKRCEFTDISHTFEYTPPHLINFFGAKTNDNFLQDLMNTNLNSSQFKDNKSFKEYQVEKLLKREVETDAYLSDLTIILQELENSQMDIHRYKFRVNRLYRDILNNAKDEQNYILLGNTFSEYSQLPRELITNISEVLLPYNNLLDQNKNEASLILEFKYEANISFESIIRLNQYLLIVASFSNCEDLEVIQIEKGSIKQVIKGNIVSQP